MVDDAQRGSSGIAPGLALNEADRALLEQLREQIAERSTIKAAPAASDVATPEETKRARLDRNQEQLEHLFDEAVARPAVARALSETGYDVGDLRQAGTKGTWARDVAPAIATIQAPTSRDRDAQRRETVLQAARAMNDLALGQPASSSDLWIDDLERGVRVSLAGKRVPEEQVAQRLVMWAQEAMTAVSQPVATAARTILIERAFESELNGEGKGQGKLEPALRVALERAGMVPAGTDHRDIMGEGDLPSETKARRANHQNEEAAPVDLNRMVAPDGAETLPARRQVADLAEVAKDTRSEPKATEASLLARLRGYLAGVGEGPSPGAPGQAEDGEALPDALRRRYAVHVSRDGGTIELFEAGAKAAAITLDAKSITTSHNDGVVISDVILLARDRGWQSLKVSGTAEFKDAVWLEASKAGLTVQHEPSSAVRASFAKWDEERPANQIQQRAPSRAQEHGPRRRDDLAQAFTAKSPEERLADPRLRNAQLELMIGIRMAEKDLKRPIAEMPEVAMALTAAVREQLAQGRMFDAPFVKSDAPKRAPRQVTNPKIDADRIPPPRV